jgi:hypothetical protein
MAQTNYTPIQLYYSTTAAAVPVNTNLLNGELAINITDGKLYYKDNSGTVQVIATKGAGTIGGSTTQIQYNNAGALAGSSAMVFNNSTNVVTLTTLNLTNALGAIYGGTGQSTYTTGDLLYSSAANTLSKLAIGTANYILTVNSGGTNVQWSAPSSISVSTATNLAGGLAGSVPYQSGASTTTFLAIGAADRVMTSSGSAPQWVTALTGLTGVSSSSITNTSLTSGRVVYSGASGVQTDSANLTFNGTTLSAGGFSTTGLSTLVKTVTVGNSNFDGGNAFAPATPAKLYIGTGTVTDMTTPINGNVTTGAITSLAITPIAADKTGVTYTNAATLYIDGAPSNGTNISITNPYALYIAAGNVYLGGGTANGVAYLNGSKVLTTGSALVFDGTVLTVGTSTGLPQTGSKLSIGNDANSALRLSISNQNAGASALVGIDFQPAGGSWKIDIPSDTAGFVPPMYFKAGASTNVTFAYGGNVGIGTSSPAYKLDVAGTAASQLRLQNSDATSYASMLFTGTGRSFSMGVGNASETGIGVANQFYIYDNTAAQTRLRLDSSGNLGLGVTPSAWTLTGAKAIQVGPFGSLSSNSSGGQVTDLGHNIFGGYSYLATGQASFYRQFDGQHQWFQAASGTAGNAITFTQAMTLDASGNLGIGTTSPGAKLEVNQAATAFPGFKITGSNSPGMQIVEATGVTAHFVNDSAGVYVGSSTSYPLVLRTNNTERARFNTTGALVFAGGTTTADGIGITFPATQSASANANTLDDYEEGTWTPNLFSAGGANPTFTSSGVYTKVGNLVTLIAKITLTSTAGAIGYYIDGFPFGVSSTTAKETAYATETTTVNSMAVFFANTTTLLMVKYDGTFYGASGYDYRICLQFTV